MKGNFDTPDTVRSPDRHPLEINTNAGAMLTDLLLEVSILPKTLCTRYIKG
jgi:hypothetical protein